MRAPPHPSPRSTMNRAALAAAIAAVLGGVGAQSAYATVPSTCSFNPSNHNLIINDHSGPASMRIYRLTTGELRFDDGTNIFGVPCPVPGGGTANVNNTDKIAVFAPSDVGSGSDSYNIDEVNGPLGPGFTPESDGNSEIEIAISTLGTRPYVQFTGSDVADRIEAGKGGAINFSPDSAPYTAEDLDVTFTSPPALLPRPGGPGNDVVPANGIGVSHVTGPANYPASLAGDADDDLLAGGSYGDFLAGGRGNDRYVTSDDNSGGDSVNEKPG